MIYAFRSNASGNKNNFEMFFFLLHCLTDLVLTAIQYYIYILHTVLEKNGSQQAVSPKLLAVFTAIEVLILFYLCCHSMNLLLENKAIHTIIDIFFFCFQVHCSLSF